MSNQEKASWSLLVINLVVGLWYFPALFAMATDLGAQLIPMVELFIRLTIASILLAILGEIVMHLAGKSKDKVELDERDRLISLKARRNGYFVLVSSVVLLMGAPILAVILRNHLGPPEISPMSFLWQAGEVFVMVNLLLLALMLAEVTIQGSRVFYYRRG